MEKNDIRLLLQEEMNSTNLRHIIDELRVICANEKSIEVTDIVDLVLNKCRSIADSRSLVDLYELKIKQLYHLHENLPVVEKLLDEMSRLAKTTNYISGLALSIQINGYIEFLKGDRKTSNALITESFNLIKNLKETDSYAYYICSYSYAVNNWLIDRDFQVVEILEECSDYFFRMKLYRSFTQCLLILVVIYQQTQNKEKSMDLIRNLTINNNLIDKIPEEIESIIHFFIGFGHLLNLNLNEAENHLLASQNILQRIYKTSVYSGYYVTALSHLTSTYALQGKLGLAWDQMKRIEVLLEEEITIKNLDSFNKIQIIHTFNLTKFYIQSRLHDFNIEKFQDLIQTIVTNVDTYHSNAIMLSEFLLNANFTKAELQDIKKLNNPSTKRVEHILDFLICQESDDDKQTLQRINTLKRRPVEERMTNVEKAFADLLAAQEYYKINRFAEIYPLLKKYKNHTHRIEVLEMRIFMEAFIQVGAFKSGDSLGPALQYMAIKKCRNYGFSRLENKLLDYLDMQKRDIRSQVL